MSLRLLADTINQRSGTSTCEASLFSVLEHLEYGGFEQQTWNSFLKDQSPNVDIRGLCKTWLRTTTCFRDIVNQVTSRPSVTSFTFYARDLKEYSNNLIQILQAKKTQLNTITIDLDKYKPCKELESFLENVTNVENLLTLKVFNASNNCPTLLNNLSQQSIQNLTCSHLGIHELNAPLPDQLINLDLSHNNVTDISPLSFLSHLQSLTITHNAHLQLLLRDMFRGREITQGTVRTITRASDQSQIKVKFNDDTETDLFYHELQPRVPIFPELRTLDVSFSNDLDDVTFFTNKHTLRTLTTLNLKRCSIKHLVAFDLPELTSLNVSENRLVDFKGILPADFKGILPANLPKLQTLDLSNNKLYDRSTGEYIEKIVPEEFVTTSNFLPSLTSLNLAHNGIQSLDNLKKAVTTFTEPASEPPQEPPPVSPHGLANLQTLDLSGNFRDRTGNLLKHVTLPTAQTLKVNKYFKNLHTVTT